MATGTRLLVTGDREWISAKIIRGALESVPFDTVVIDGTARGADLMAHSTAALMGLKTERYPAYWSCDAYEKDKGEPCGLPDGRHNAVHGRPAGVLRNQRMLDEGKPTLVYAFHDDLDASKGTKDMVDRARRAGLKVVLYSHTNPDGVVL